MGSTRFPPRERSWRHNVIHQCKKTKKRRICRLIHLCTLRGQSSASIIISAQYLITSSIHHQEFVLQGSKIFFTALPCLASQEAKYGLGPVAQPNSTARSRNSEVTKIETKFGSKSTLQSTNSLSNHKRRWKLVNHLRARAVVYRFTPPPSTPPPSPSHPTPPA